MSERDDKPIASEEPARPPRAAPHACAAVCAASSCAIFRSPLHSRSSFWRFLAVGLYFVASSAAFENVVRKRLIAQIEELTGGRAEIASFHWRLLHLEAEADGVVIHGLEDPGEAPYAKIEHLRVVFSLRNLFSPSVLLRSLEIDRPRLHFIVYPDGSTNQPHPRQPQTSSKSAIDNLFDLQAGRIAVEQGNFDYDSRAASFDYQNRYAPLDFSANDASLVMRYVPRDAAYARVLSHRGWAPPISISPAPCRAVRCRCTERCRPRSISSTRRCFCAPCASRPRGAAARAHLLKSPAISRTSRIRTGTRTSRAIWTCGSSTRSPAIPMRPRVWPASISLRRPAETAAFHIDGGVHIDGGSYIGAGVTATGITLDTHVHADHKQLLITKIVARLRQGGQIEGTVALEPWLPSDPSAYPQRTAHATEESPSDRNTLVRTPIWIIPVNGKVTANFKDVALDTVLDMVSPAPYRRLGLDARLNGPADCHLDDGDGNTVSVNAQLGLSPSRQTPRAKRPTTGAIDATYAQRNGSVELRKLELHLPRSDLEAHGLLGAYPTRALRRSPSISIRTISRNSTPRCAVSASSATAKPEPRRCPCRWRARQIFTGSWTGSLVRPHIAGTVEATQLAFEMPAAAGSSGPPQILRFDSVSATGSVFAVADRHPARAARSAATCASR